MGKNKLHDREKEKDPAGFQLHHESRLEGNSRVGRKPKTLQVRDALTAKPEFHNPYDRPKMPYRRLIIQALISSPTRSLSLRDIYTWIESTYPYFLYDQRKSWKNAVRHNLSIQRAFKKIPKEPKSEEKSCLWELTNETGTNRRVPARRASEPITLLAPPPLHPITFRQIRAMPVPSVEQSEGQSQKKKRRSSEPTVRTHPVPILPKSLFLEDQPTRIISPMLASSQSLDDSWLTPDFYSTPFPYSQLNIDEYLYHQPPWMNKSDQSHAQTQDDVLQQQSAQLFPDFPLDLIAGEQFLVRFQDN